MFRTLGNIRDFLDPEKMKMSVDSLKAETFLTVRRYEKGEDGVSKPYLHIFTATGTYIGSIEYPDG